ncbi:AMP-binding protein, partial [Limnohabitans sp.]|uniref:AMP-binding protein n=1 Tax=Limnohabitans sp. TaxID=1907725 RepID=UPI0037C1395E
MTIATHAISDAAAPAPYLPQIRLYQNWLREQRGLSFDTYNDLWRWSVTELDAFWQSIWDYFDLQSPTAHSAVLAGNVMPCAQWFPGAQTNYAQQVLRHVPAAHAAGFLAVISHNEKGLRREMSWPELRRQVAAMALHLQAQGVQPGDRVAAYLPNIPEAMVAFLATASVGGVWSICAPDMGTHAVLDRFKQIEPKVLIAVDGVSYGGRDFDRMGVVQELRDALPSVQHVIIHENLGTLDLTNCDVGASAQMSMVTARDDAQVQAFEPMWLAFDHPLWIVYSSGTTGLPKPIVHGHGGTVIVALANKILHNDIGCSYQPNSWGERFHWYSSTGWVMWNAQVAGLLNGVTCVIYDGNPGGSKERPDWGLLWRMAAEEKVTFFGAGAAYFANCQKAGVELSRCGDLSRVRALGTTGSPLSAETQSWGTAQFRKIRHAAPSPAAMASPMTANASPPAAVATPSTVIASEARQSMDHFAPADDGALSQDISTAIANLPTANASPPTANASPPAAMATPFTVIASEARQSMDH